MWISGYAEAVRRVSLAKAGAVEQARTAKKSMVKPLTEHIPYLSEVLPENPSLVIY